MIICMISLSFFFHLGKRKATKFFFSRDKLDTYIRIFIHHIARTDWNGQGNYQRHKSGAKPMMNNFIERHLFINDFHLSFGIWMHLVRAEGVNTGWNSIFTSITEFCSWFRCMCVWIKRWSIGIFTYPIAVDCELLNWIVNVWLNAQIENVNKMGLCVCVWGREWN